ncbi:sigma-70 family RNA polymerase sigma factor [Marinifilum fragile]|uniref:RNA polymerase sigma factor n=1 Tax=Marinifilum fragile TaxID=570161 RepID=UPI002AA95FA4|nr:sigma-70 family RNA polymerase sigma factor [Marinifilum fragile]
MPLEDKKILDLLQTNKQKGLMLLFDCYYKPLVILAEMYLKNEHSAEDTVQEQFIKFWDKKLFNQVKSYAALKNYLFTMVKNASLNKVRKTDILMESDDLLEADVAENTAQNLSEEAIIKIKQAIQNLPEGTRNVVECIVIQDMKYKEAAEELNVSINTIKTQLKRGILKLREELKDKEELLLLFLLSKRK